MKILDRYIIKIIWMSIGLVTLMLAGLQIFILFVNQLDDLGRNDYGIWQALIYVLLQMPYHVYLFFPMASLLGSLIGLGILANHRELIVMRSAGFSIYQITLSVLKAALLLIVIVTILGETLVPKLARMANDERMQALSGGQALRTARGVWLRYQNDFITIGTVMPGNILQNVVQFHFDPQHHMKFARKLEQVSFSNGSWQAKNIEETHFNDEQTSTQKMAAMRWDVDIKPAILSVSANEPDEMSLHELNQYLRIQKSTHQSASNYQLAFWQRIFQPFSTVVMMILAIPFVFGPLRSSTMSSKLLAGATVGFSFHIINRFFGPVSQVLQWPPLFAAAAPTLIFALLGLYLMRRVK